MDWIISGCWVTCTDWVIFADGHMLGSAVSESKCYLKLLDHLKQLGHWNQFGPLRQFCHLSQLDHLRQLALID